MHALKSASSFANTAPASASAPSRSFAPSTISFLRQPSPPPAGATAFVNLIILQKKPKYWSISSSPSPLAAESQVHVETLGSQPEAEHGTKTVHVKFLMERACSYGEAFFLSGDDPIFGLRNPSDAIPLNWSEGHIWSIELDLPVGRTIQYKFVLKCNNGEIKWQPGPDRILKTWETKNTLVISEDWRFVRLQKIREVEGETGERNGSVLFQELEAGSITMAQSSDHLLETEDGEVLITRGDAFPEKVLTIEVADACVREGDEDPPPVSL